MPSKRGSRPNSTITMPLPNPTPSPSTKASASPILADLSLLRNSPSDDAASVTSSKSSNSSRGGRRRRRGRGGKGQGGQQQQDGQAQPQAKSQGIKPVEVLPRISETKPVRLQIGLNLDLELELKAKIRGDVTLTLLAERKRTARPQGSTELVLPREEDEHGCRSVANELFYMRLGKMRLSRRWDERSVSARLTALVVMGIASVGFAGGLLAGRILEEWGKSRRCDLYL